MHIVYHQEGEVALFRVIHIDRGSIYRGDGVVGQPARWIGGPPQEGADPEVVLGALLERAAEEGYATLPQDTLMIQQALEGWGSDEDLRRRHTIESLLTNALLSLGFGTIDGGDIGSGKMTVFASVIRPEQAAECCVSALREAKLLDGVVIVAAPPEDDAEHVAFWPPDYDPGDFSIL
ncbi:MAG: hypothetical protein ACI8S6_001545 [Myxococcota bacterium]|jgi:hypothetical protein